MNASVTIVRANAMPETARIALHALHRRYFDNSTLSAFLRDFNEKDWVILVCNDQEEFLGFSTIQCLRLTCLGESVRFMFTGDTIISPEAWRYDFLAPAIGLFQTEFLDESPAERCYWFLITKGYRTYKGLPTFYNAFYPCHDRPTPQREAMLLHCVARYKFGDNFDPATNIISFARPHDFLRPDMQRVAPGREQNPHIRFFLEKNPLFTIGNELACITELSRDNFNRAARRVIAIGRKTVRWEHSQGVLFGKK